ncbi:MAG: hypothetical protein K0S41_980 [Anaerocolumna sp.]|jgi:ferredoxin|nr:hypothetical protein [Anaerocolumna sp.]
MDKVLIHYFSGTGNTYHMVKVIGEKLIQSGYEVVYKNMENKVQVPIDEYNLHIFAYPIYAFGTPSIVLNYMRKLKTNKNSNAAIICTCYEFEGQSLHHTTHLLKLRNFNVTFTDVALYPANWTEIVNPSDEVKQKEMIINTDNQLDEFIDKIINTKVTKKKCKPIHLLWTWFLFLLFYFLGRRFLGKLFIADSSCNSCKMCIHNCPVKAIKLNKGKPKWNWKCENCQRCINVCPKKSIQTSIVKILLSFLALILVFFELILLNKIFEIQTFYNVILFLILNVFMTLLTDILINFLERVQVVHKILEYSYTKKYRRYLMDGFKGTIR